jgi:hypothetical protein
MKIFTGESPKAGATAGGDMVFSNRSINIDVCPPCYERMTLGLKNVLQLSTGECVSHPYLFCDFCRNFLQVDGEPRSRLGLLIDLKPAFEALPEGAGPQAIRSLVESTSHAKMAHDYSTQMWLRDLAMAGFTASLSERIVASLPHLIVPVGPPVGMIHMSAYRDLGTPFGPNAPPIKMLGFSFGQSQPSESQPSESEFESQSQSQPQPQPGFPFWRGGTR